MVISVLTDIGSPPPEGRGVRQRGMICVGKKGDCSGVLEYWKEMRITTHNADLSGENSNSEGLARLQLHLIRLYAQKARTFRHWSTPCLLHKLCRESTRPLGTLVSTAHVRCGHALGRAYSEVGVSQLRHGSTPDDGGPKKCQRSVSTVTHLQAVTDVLISHAQLVG